MEGHVCSVLSTDRGTELWLTRVNIREDGRWSKIWRQAKHWGWGWMGDHLFAGVRWWSVCSDTPFVGEDVSQPSAGDEGGPGSVGALWVCTLVCTLHCKFVLVVLHPTDFASSRRMERPWWCTAGFRAHESTGTAIN